MGRNIKIIPASVDAKIHGLSGRGADEAGNALFMAFIESFGQSQEKGHHTNFLHLQVRKNADMGIGLQEFAGIAMMESADEGAHDLFSVGPAEYVGIGGDVSAMPGMAVVVDDGAGIMA